jgi:hypothetical protein
VLLPVTMASWFAKEISMFESPVLAVVAASYIRPRLAFAKPLPLTTRAVLPNVPRR